MILLQHCLAQIKDSKVSKRNKTSSIKNIKKIIVLVETAITDSTKSFCELSPLPNLAYAQKRICTAKEKEECQQKEMEIIESKQQPLAKTKNQPKGIKIPKKKIVDALYFVVLPKGNAYTVAEAVPQLANMESGFKRYKQF